MAAHEADFLAGAGKALAFKRLGTLQLRDPLRSPLQLRVSEALVEGLATAAKLARLKEVLIPRAPPSGDSSKALGALRQGVQKLVVGGGGGDRGGAGSDMYRGAAGGAAEFVARRYCLSDGTHSSGGAYREASRERNAPPVPMGSVRLPVRPADLTPDGSLLLEACSWGQEGVARVYNLLSSPEGGTQGEEMLAHPFGASHGRITE